MKIKSIVILIILFVVCICALFCCNSKKIKVEASCSIVASTIKSDKPILKVFIENSGSMDGYMCAGSQLKDAVYDYVSDLNRNTDTTNLYYINSTVIPYKGNLMAYIKDLNPSSFSQAGGNRSNTDLGNILATVLKNIDDTTVVIFVSDCILDLPSKNAQKYLKNCEIRIKDEIVNTRKRIPDLGVEILQLISDFNGNYYSPNGEVKFVNGKRPYYIWILGNKNYLAKLNKDVPLSKLNAYDLNNNIVAFSNQSEVPFEIKNKTLSGDIVNSNHGDYNITIRADFLTTLQPESVILNKNNYGFNNSNLRVDGVFSINDKDTYTHYINFTIPKGTQVAGECLTFKCAQLPVWVSDSNDETGTDTSKNKTTGIKFLVQGVQNAYNDVYLYTKMEFEVKRK